MQTEFQAIPSSGGALHRNCSWFPEGVCKSQGDKAKATTPWTSKGQDSHLYHSWEYRAELIPLPPTSGLEAPSVHIPRPAQGGKGLGEPHGRRGLGDKNWGRATAFSHVSFVVYHLKILIIPTCQLPGVWRNKTISAYDPVHKKWATSKTSISNVSLSPHVPRSQLSNFPALSILSIGKPSTSPQVPNTAGKSHNLSYYKYMTSNLTWPSGLSNP